MSEPLIRWRNKTSVRAAVNRWPDIFERNIVAFLELAALKLAGRTADLAPTGIGVGGNLATSIVAMRPVPTGNGWMIFYGTSVEYAEVIEYGRTPGSAMPPVDELARWVWLKGPQLGFEFETEEEAAEIAYRIARKIAKYGFASGPVAGKNGGTAWAMFERAREEMYPEIRRDMLAMRRQIVKECTEALGAA